MIAAACLRRSALLLGASAFLGLGGCASFNAHPDPVRSVSKEIKAAEEYTFEKAMENWIAPPSPMTKRDVRDKYIILQMRAIDARYGAFLGGLAQQSRSTNLLLDVATLGLTGGASFAAEKTSHILSSGATAVVGGRAAFNKDLFYERTLPALIDEMNAARTNAQVALAAGIARPPEQYTLAMADIDLSRYAGAANLDSALQQLTGAAAKHVDIADTQYVAEFKACVPKPEVFEPRGKLMDYIKSLDSPSNNSKLVGMSEALGLPTKDAQAVALDSPALIKALRQYVTAKICDAASAKQLADSWDSTLIK